MKPYLETKVVKVKKEEKEWTPDCCPCCGAKREAEKPLGNWVNGENLDKIKFPCFCTHKDKSSGYSGYGMLISGIDGSSDKEYVLVDIGKQREQLTTVSSNKSLKELIEIWDIHILKGKIILFEEE